MRVTSLHRNVGDPSSPPFLAKLLRFAALVVCLGFSAAALAQTNDALPVPADIIESTPAGWLPEWASLPARQVMHNPAPQEVVFKEVETE